MLSVEQLRLGVIKQRGKTQPGIEPRSADGLTEHAFHVALPKREPDLCAA